MTGPILLPEKPALKTDKPHMLDWGGPLTPALGGPVQTLMRLGTRHSLDFVLPRMRAEPFGRIWSARLRMAKLFGALLPFGQDGFKPGSPGAIVVDGAGQSGMSLKVKGGTPAYPIREGQAFSIVTNGRRYLYFASAKGFLDASGGATVQIFPMLRVMPADGDVCEFGRPMIQGSLAGNEVAWDRDTSPWFDFGTITITEDE
ncbi:hypothetical protein [Sphingomonas abietis]|uniref:Uncharacterized protein n=1 Tax=Sphingomonas abietis TaxID=3012344 RepID=A0ABY7NRB6_9SPHN|nr:hypothetical protein [Sphingomonas abietis]WBO23928.1 hypothetical protein PBT88_07415 [Sphingomonas abietis]